MAKKEELPNLEEIAQRLTSVEEDFKLAEIQPRIADAYLSMARHKDEKGRVRYKHDFSKEPEKVKELSDAIFDAIAEHIHLLEYNIQPDQYGELRNIRNPSGVSYTDMHAQLALGLSRELLRKNLDKIKDNLTLQAIMELINKQISENYIQQKQQQILAPIDETHTEHIKKYITEKAAKHNLPVYGERIKDKKILAEVLPEYIGIANQIYRKK